MTSQEKLRFENYAHRCGYNVKREGDRYCQGVVNQLKDAWFAALKGHSALPGNEAQELHHGQRQAMPRSSH